MQDDIQIEHNEGRTTIHGVDTEKVKRFRDELKSRGGSGDLHFDGVKKISRIRPDGTPHQMIYGEDDRG